LSIIWYSKKKKEREHDVTENGFVLNQVKGWPLDCLYARFGQCNTCTGLKILLPPSLWSSSYSSLCTFIIPSATC